MNEIFTTVVTVGLSLWITCLVCYFDDFFILLASILDLGHSGRFTNHLLLKVVGTYFLFIIILPAATPSTRQKRAGNYWNLNLVYIAHYFAVKFLLYLKILTGICTLLQYSEQFFHFSCLKIFEWSKWLKYAPVVYYPIALLNIQ